MPAEQWKPIGDFWNRYEVSDLGRFRNVKTGQILRPFIDHQGYMIANLPFSEFGRKNLRVHRLVAMAFIPNPEAKKDVNHKDGNRKNNHLENLEWATRSENMIHSFDVLFSSPRGSKRPNAKLSEAQVVEIRSSRDRGDSLAIKYSVSQGLISAIRRRNVWRHVP